MKTASKLLVALLTMSGVMFGSPVFATPGQYPSQQAQQQAQREAQARREQNLRQQYELQAQLQRQRDSFARQQQEENIRRQHDAQRQIDQARHNQKLEQARQERNRLMGEQFARNQQSLEINSRRYRIIEKATPMVRIVRDCSLGAVGSLIPTTRVSASAMAMGCVSSFIDIPA